LVKPMQVENIARALARRQVHFARVLHAATSLKAYHLLFGSVFAVRFYWCIGRDTPRV
jgi:hypothetical protein